jgi:hypothetical protein
VCRNHKIVIQFQKKIRTNKTISAGSKKGLLIVQIFNEMYMKSLKITKGQSESVNRRRTDNTMVKIKRTNNDLQNIHIQLKIK